MLLKKNKKNTFKSIFLFNILHTWFHPNIMDTEISHDLIILTLFHTFLFLIRIHLATDKPILFFIYEPSTSDFVPNLNCCKLPRRQSHFKMAFSLLIKEQLKHSVQFQEVHPPGQLPSILQQRGVKFTAYCLRCPYYS